ncbi:RNA polymerase sigma factor [Nonomuraea muscovyensis]|uniref:RNA polymerase sigma-70 factor (ECF subfamily) n=1 Tax=Nonomuraea muscovyensis TaxID=1124761 RepID=A0A7X0BXV6_9ACTN|nr:sigma-70 family RNA polymerase sigma factor [Nonomuraea muscovyensis]MBB6344737.1 RNA polymerase sigma-70 factor (ECF subfamily) [Nonomuraea muscovyensis]MDF2711742.1 polymerase subunit sigma-24 [Nonomuraea muscovyensis]
MDDDRKIRFEAVYAQTYEQILGYAVRRCDSPEDAADVVAETFAIAWRRVDVLPPGEQARLWLYGVARNVLANHRRGVARRRLTELDADVADLYGRTPEEGVELGAIVQALRRLPEADRELLSLVAWEGLDAGQIAEVLGCSRNAVRIRLYRARRRFSRTLAGAGVTVHIPVEST